MVEPAAEPVDRALELGVLERGERAARLADRVVVMVAVRGHALEPGRPLPRVQPLDEAELVERVERPVDAGEPDLAVAAVELAGDLLGAHAAVLGGEQLDHGRARAARLAPRVLERAARLLGPVRHRYYLPLAMRMILIIVLVIVARGGGRLRGGRGRRRRPPGARHLRRDAIDRRAGRGRRRHRHPARPRGRRPPRLRAQRRGPARARAGGPDHRQRRGPRGGDPARRNRCPRLRARGERRRAATRGPARLDGPHQGRRGPPGARRRPRGRRSRQARTATASGPTATRPSSPSSTSASRGGSTRSRPPIASSSPRTTRSATSPTATASRSSPARSARSAPRRSRAPASSRTRSTRSRRPAYRRSSPRRRMIPR